MFAMQYRAAAHFLVFSACLAMAISGEAWAVQDPQDSMPNLPTLRRLSIPLTELKLSDGAEPPTLFDEMPVDNSADLFRTPDEATPRGVRNPWPTQRVCWSAPEYWHRPLYFEDAPLERYGQTISPVLQPATSATRFYATLFVLPYKMTLTRPWGCVPNLGYCRPGSPTRPMREGLPWDARAAFVEAATVAGVVWALP